MKMMLTNLVRLSKGNQLPWPHLFGPGSCPAAVIYAVKGSVSQIEEEDWPRSAQCKTECCKRTIFWFFTLVLAVVLQ